MEENKENTPIPYFVHEMNMTRMEIIVKRLWITVILLILLLVGSNIAWIVYENSFIDSISYEAEQDGENNELNIVGGDMYGKTESKGNKIP